MKKIGLLKSGLCWFMLLLLAACTATGSGFTSTAKSRAAATAAAEAQAKAAMPAETVAPVKVIMPTKPAMSPKLDAIAPTAAGKAGGLMQCSEPRRQMCTREYRPVCAQKADGTTGTYSNPCTACSNAIVKSYTPGGCN